MNLKISKNDLRFRITKEELGQLGENGFLAEEILLPTGNIIGNITNKISFTIKIINSNDIDLNSKEGSLLLSIPQSSLEFLIRNHPCKDGISKQILVENNLLNVALEVDVFKKRN